MWTGRAFIRMIILCFTATINLLSAKGQSEIGGLWKADYSMPGNVSNSLYLDLHQEGKNLRGTMWFSWGPEAVVNSVSDPEGFTLRFGGGIPISVKVHLDDTDLDVVIEDPRVERQKLKAFRVASLPSPPTRIALPPLEDISTTGDQPRPPMGWNSWNHFNNKVTDVDVRTIVDAMVASGMRDAGYRYVLIDDSWAGGRDSKGAISGNSKFPDMAGLVRYVHSHGMKFGIYSSPGPRTCGGYLGSFGHEGQDAHTFASWGVDYLKYDWCTASEVYKPEEMRTVYQKMGKALHQSGRTIVYSLCQYGMEDVSRWGSLTGASLWRTVPDISDSWNAIVKNALRTLPLSGNMGPNRWNDPDMLEVGNGGMTTDEYRTHMTLWALLQAPLIAGNDPRHMSPDVRSILLNSEVVRIDQDGGGGVTRKQLSNGLELWSRSLSDGTQAIAIINMLDHDSTASLGWQDISDLSVGEAEDVWKSETIQIDRSWRLPQLRSHAVFFITTRPGGTQ